jgi:hypothetical protein
LAEKRFDTPGSLLHMPPDTFVSEFLAPNMTWQNDWAIALLQHGHLPATSRLPAKVRKRLLWQLFSDLTYQSQRGRTLERIGKVTMKRANNIRPIHIHPQPSQWRSRSCSDRPRLRVARRPGPSCRRAVA